MRKLQKIEKEVLMVNLHLNELMEYGIFQAISMAIQRGNLKCVRGAGYSNMAEIVLG